MLFAPIRLAEEAQRIAARTQASASVPPAPATARLARLSAAFDLRSISYLDGSSIMQANGIALPAAVHATFFGRSAGSAN